MSTESKTTNGSTTNSGTQRVITIVTTRGEKTKIPFEGTDWADLKKILERGGKDVDGKSFSSFNLSNMKCVEGTNKTTLEHIKAVVPDGDFNLFLMPVKSKSGGMSRIEINATIKEFIAADGDKAKSHFTVDGKNYTQVGSSKLEELIESYKPGTKRAVAKNKSAAIAEVVTSVKEAKANNDDVEVLAQLSGLSDSEKLDLVIRLILDVKNNVNTGSTASNNTDEVKSEQKEEEVSAKAKEETAEEKQAREAEEERVRKEKEEDKRLKDEMEEMMGGLDDVKRY